MKLNKSTLLICALCAGAVADAELRAGDSTIAAAPVKAAIAPPDYKGPVAYEGKVMVVNRSEKTITVQINGKLHLFKVGPQARVLRKGKPVSLLDVEVGKKITAVASSEDDGSLRIASLSLDGSATEAEPAGKEPKTKRKNRKSGAHETVPTTN